MQLEFQMNQKTVLVDNKLYEVVATAHDEDTNKDFVVYTSRRVEPNKGVTLSCVLYHEVNGEFIPEKITDAEDKETAKKLIISVMESITKLSQNKK